VCCRALRSCRRHKPATPVLVGELAVPATLSRWRSWVRIPSRTLGDIVSGTVRKRAKRRSSNLREFVGSTPTRATSREGEAPPGMIHNKKRVGWALARPSGCNPPARWQCRFDSCPTHCFRLSSNSARSSIGTGRRPLKPQRRVRLPHGSLNLGRKTEPVG
jgi:hypothetical protein